MVTINPGEFQGFIDQAKAQQAENQELFDTVDGNGASDGGKDGAVSEAEFLKYAEEQGINETLAAQIFKEHSGEDGSMDVAELAAADYEIGMYRGIYQISDD